jgi:alkylation response protein AidB-like acyl-CoA dehydrogenase
MALAGLPIDERRMILDTLAKFRQRRLTSERIRELDEKEEFPSDIIKELLGPAIGLQLVFIPEEYGGMGGGARDIAAISEEMAKMCLGVATALLAIHLGTDPILVGATHEQKGKWLKKIAEEGSIVAYAVTEPEAGSNLSSLKTSATPISDESGKIVTYRVCGNKQFITNGGYADFLTVLAQAPEGPTFFIIENGTPGFHPGKHEVKHGIRCSNTAPIVFDNVEIPVENLIGGIPGRGLLQANQVFGYTRLMVAAFGLGAGIAALEKVIPYARQRVQFGSALFEKQGYTHKLILPHIVRLEAARAYIEEVAERLDTGESDLEVEGSIAKLFATEAGNRCADDAIQALGGYGYITEYDVEKIKRDVKITTIYEGTSEIQQLIISTFRWRTSIRSKGDFYNSIAAHLDEIYREINDCGASVFARLARNLNVLIQAVHTARLTKQQHIMFELANLMTSIEVGNALMKKIHNLPKENSTKFNRLKLCGRVFASDAEKSFHAVAQQLIYGCDCWTDEDISSLMSSMKFDPATAHCHVISDMDQLLAFC